MGKLIKTASFTVVLVLVVVSPVSAFATNDNPCILGDSSIVLVGIQQADGSIDIVYLNPDNARAAQSKVRGEMVSMFPDAMTIGLLGLAGLFYRRRSTLAFVRSRS
jgi:hypothetical protein